MRNKLARSGVAIAALALAPCMGHLACTSAPAEGGHQGQNLWDAATDRDSAGLDASDVTQGDSDANDASEANDASSALSCSQTVAEFCATDVCVTKWPADLAALCLDPPLMGLAGLQFVYDCAGFHIAHTQGVDMQVLSVYETATGDLVAILAWSANSGKTSCVGPSPLDLPSCALPGHWPPVGASEICLPGEAGSDAGGE